MNRNRIEGTEETVCQGCSRIALSHLALDLDEPTNGWSAFFRERSIEMLEDDLGRPSLRREDARAVISERQRWERENAESIRHRQEVVARESRPVHPGLPRPPHADEKLSAFEVMRGADAELSGRIRAGGSHRKRSSFCSVSADLPRSLPRRSE